MNAHVRDRQSAVLVDDDAHSARLLLRTLADQGAPRVEWMGDPARAPALLSAIRKDSSVLWPDLIIVDIKSSSSASAEFIKRIAADAAAMDAVIVAMAPSLDCQSRDPLHAAGAAAVFERHPDIVAYRREVAELLRFWARSRDIAVNADAASATASNGGLSA